MIWLLLVIFIALAIWGGVKFHRDSRSEAGFYLLVFGLVFTIVAGVALPLTALTNGEGLAKWQAFYYANATNYQVAVDKTASYLSTEKYIEEALIPIEGSIERLKLTDAVSTRVQEWRNAVNEYNTTIASMQYYDRNIFTGALVPNEVQQMRLLVIQ